MLVSCNTKLPETGGEGAPDKIPDEDPYGVAYVFDLTALPEMHISVPIAQWNRLLEMYDANNHTKQYVHCNASFIKDGEQTHIDDMGLRLRGNTSRRRPEGSAGEKHVPGKADFRHCHFGLNFRKYVKDDEHTVKGCRKAILKWFKDDPLYAREIYCFDLFRRFGIWTAVNNSYCRLWLRVAGDAEETYFGVYQLQESIDTRYLKHRKKEFDGDDGNLWKCQFGASLASVDAQFGVDTGGDEEYVYELKTDDNDFEQAKVQLKNFITRLNSKNGQEFHDWIASVCDVDLLLRTYAVNVAVGMWDDYWNNTNNYYIYFNTTDPDNYKFFLIPYDYDNTLGTCSNCGVQNDAGRHDPYKWGSDANPLIAKILSFSDYRKIYTDALLELVSDGNAYLNSVESASRIRSWHSLIRDFVSNDTGEDMKIEDKPASWGNHPEYRVLETGSSNFLKTRTESIKSHCR